MRRRSTPKNTAPSIRFDQCPAKTFIGKDGKKQLGRNVFNHCQIVGHVARALLDTFPPKMREKLFPEGVVLPAASHDVGKVSPTFVLKLISNIDSSPDAHLFLATSNLEAYRQYEEKNWGGHAGVSVAALKAEGFNQSIQSIAGQHHGAMPDVSLRTATAEYFGGEAWQSERKALLQALQNEFNVDWPQDFSETQVRVCSGLTSVADWIGSGSDFEDPDTDWQQNIPKAINNAGYTPFKLKNNLTFSDVFGFTARESQQKLIDLCREPGVYVLEAPMEVGKTEAALYCAYQLLQSEQAKGIFFALPTRLTSNKIYDRFNGFLKQILSEDCDHRQSLLLHGHAWLENTEIGEEGQPGHSWFNSSKRGLLAPFAVGTLDQALMAAMNVRHGFVRAFGLAGKVVILDEVHSYDPYTSVILDRLIALLKEMHCTVIILSATLNLSRKESLLATKLNDHQQSWWLKRVSP